MASKSKKRRRVFRASCILAALIIAGSSFAWFTSKDEVTNRLSANADYDVRIVESFAPPKNWLPGQEIDKDVFAINTGSIDAFVKETVSSKIAIKREVRVDAPTPIAEDNSDPNNPVAAETDEAFAARLNDFVQNNDLVELKPAERYSVEAGSYLALRPYGSTVELGRKVVDFKKTGATGDEEPTGLEDYEGKITYDVDGGTIITDFIPDASGVYVFRRSIDINDDRTKVGDEYKDNLKYLTEDFEYDAYYYDKTTDRYYKVELTNVTGDGDRDLAYDGVDTDGQLTSAEYRFFKEETTVETPKLTYDAAAHELIATIDGFSYRLTDTEIKTLGTNRDNALHRYENALLQLYAEVENYEGLTNTERAAYLAYIQAQIDELRAKRTYDNEVDNFDSLYNQLKNTKEALDDKTKNTTEANDCLDDAAEDLFGSGANYKTYYPDTVTNPVEGYGKTSGKKVFDAAGIPDPSTLTTHDDDTDTDVTTGWATDGGNWNTWYNTNINGKVGGKFKNYVDAKHTYELTTHTSEEAFMNELRAYIDTLNASHTSSDPAYIDYSGFTTIEEFAEAMTVEQIRNFKGVACTNHNEYENYAAYMIAEKEYNDAVKFYETMVNQVNALDKAYQANNTAVEDSLKKLYGDDAIDDDEDVGSADRWVYHPAYNDGTNNVAKAEPTNETSSTTDMATYGYFGDYTDKHDDTELKKTAYEEAQAASGNVAGTPAPDSAKDRYNKALKEAVDAKNALDSAEMKYEQAKDDYNKVGDIIIHIGLENETVYGGVADKWQLLPVKTANDTFDNGEAVFYYTSLLAPGETSKKLINYVKLDESASQDMYKAFDFDLNVNLDSVQITKSNTDDVITTTAVESEWSEIDVALSDPTSLDTAITWTAEDGTEP